MTTKKEPGTQAVPEPNTEQSNCHSAANGNEAPCGATAVEAAPTASNLTLAVIGREHFGNPIPREWYAAARALLANLPPAKETK